MRAVVACLLTLTLFAPAARAEGVADVLGDEYAAADAPGKLVLLSVAAATKRVERRDASAEVDAVTRAHVAPGATPRARLELLGTLRAAAQAQLKELNGERRKAGERTVGFIEPDGDFQAGLGLAFVAATAGPRPALEDLGCLALVRESTNWTSHHHLVLAFVSEALQRDPAYAEADHEGKLAIVKRISEDQQMMSNQERKYVEEAVVADWMSGLLAAGEAPEAVRAKLDAWKKRRLVCFFTQSWADDLLEQLATLPASGGEEGAEKGE